jgi:hypothetical protein
MSRCSISLRPLHDAQNTPVHKYVVTLSFNTSSTSLSRQHARQVSLRIREMALIIVPMPTNAEAKLAAARQSNSEFNDQLARCSGASGMPAAAV